MTLLFALYLSFAPVLWQPPSAVGSVDFSLPARQVPPPLPPFRFLHEDMSGNSPKILISDAAGITWQVKGGPEGRTEAFVTRLVSALGYYTDAVHFIERGKIQGIDRQLRRAAGFISPDGTFTSAAFERREPNAVFRPDRDWDWRSNPFYRSKPLQGLKILVMLVSNWDNKDRRNVIFGSNTAALDIREGDAKSRYYYVTDWGQSLGAWGKYLWSHRSNWNCADFERQTEEFVTGLRHGYVQFGFGGQHTAGFSDDIRVEDVAWLMQWLGQVSDEQIRTGLAASGATPDQQDCFTRELRKRIEQLRRAADFAALR